MLTVSGENNKHLYNVDKRVKHNRNNIILFPKIYHDIIYVHSLAKKNGDICMLSIIG